MISSNIPQNIYSLTNLHIYNNIDSIDVTSYPNLISLSNNIYNGKNHYGKCIINYDTDRQRLEIINSKLVIFISEFKEEYLKILYEADKDYYKYVIR